MRDTPSEPKAFTVETGKLPRILHLPANLQSFYQMSFEQYRSFRQRHGANGLDFCLMLSCQPCHVNLASRPSSPLYSYPSLTIFAPGNHPHMAVGTDDECFIFSYHASAQDFFRTSGISLSTSGKTFLHTARISMLLKELQILMEAPSLVGVPDRIDLLTLELLFEIVLNFRLDNPVTSDEDNWDLVIRISRYLDQHLDADLNIDALIERFGISRRTFFRYWKKHFHSTPMAYVQSKRIETAMCLLAETDLKIFEIASYCGFSSAAEFCTAFRKKNNISPLQFKKNLMGDKPL